MDTVEMAEVGAKELWRRTKYLIDCHVHVGAAPTVAKLAESIHSPADWGDLSGVSTGYSEEDKLRTAIEARLSAEEREQIAWKTANQVFKLGLRG